MSVELRRVAPGDAPWDEIGVGPDSTVFQRREWLELLATTQHAEPVVASVRSDGAHVGWFTGAIVRRFGVRLLGSPMPGWTTSYMGFTLERPELRPAAVAALARFAFGELGCLHLELMDRWLEAPVTDLPRSAWSVFHSSEVTLRDDESMLASMNQSARRNIRRAESRGVVVERVDPLTDPGFAAEYHAQVSQSFAKRGLAPTYGVERVQAMIDHLHPSDLVVLLRARAPDGRSAATGLFPGSPNGSAVFWMGASDPGLLDLRPNEAVMWRAMREWRDRGAVRLDLGGGGSFKPKFGPTPIEVPWLRCSRVPGLEPLRRTAAGAARRAQRVRFLTRR